MLGISLEVGIKSTMAFDGDDGRKVKFSSLKRFLPTSPMGAMGMGNRRENKWRKKEKRPERA